MPDISTEPSSSHPTDVGSSATTVDQTALAALSTWTPDHSTNSIRCQVGTPSLVYDGKTAFTARGQFELPDGGRFYLLLSGSLPDPAKTSRQPEPLTVMIEDDLGLPDGFLIDINTYLFGSLADADPNQTPPALVHSVLKHASKLYEKLVSEAPAPKMPTAPVAHTQNHYSLKRRRSKLVGYNEPVFGPSRLATTTLMKQISLLQTQDTRKDGFTAEPSGNDLYIWNVKLYFEDESTTKMAADIASLPEHDCIQLEFRFPSEYPSVPPIVRVVAPYVVGGHVAPHGGLCMELLTTSGWAPVNSIDAVCIQIRTLLVHGNARVDLNKLHRVEDYTFDGALRDLRNIVQIHRWNVADPARKRPKS